MLRTTIKFRQLWNCCWNSETHVITMFDDNGHEAYHAVCKSCAAAYRRQNGENLVREILKEEVDAFKAEPRQAGDVCRSGYQRESYVVLAVRDGWIWSLWLGDGDWANADPNVRVTKHMTSWDWKKDSMCNTGMLDCLDEESYASYEEFVSVARDLI
jgi:hypothetical protein